MSTPATTMFVYGTLMFDEVVRALTGRTFRSVPARLAGYSRHCIIRNGKPDAYPAITANPEGSVSGRVLLEVDGPSLDIIRLFESDPPDYEEVSVAPMLENGKPVQATTFVAKQSIVALLEGEWNEQKFAREHLRNYVDVLAPETRRDAARAG